MVITSIGTGEVLLCFSLAWFSPGRSSTLSLQINITVRNVDIRLLMFCHPLSIKLRWDIPCVLISHYRSQRSSNFSLTTFSAIKRIPRKHQCIIATKLRSRNYAVHFSCCRLFICIGPIFPRVLITSNVSCRNQSASSWKMIQPVGFPHFIHHSFIIDPTFAQCTC